MAFEREKSYMKMDKNTQTLGYCKQIQCKMLRSLQIIHRTVSIWKRIVWNLCRNVKSDCCFSLFARSLSLVNCITRSVLCFCRLTANNVCNINYRMRWKIDLTPTVIRSHKIKSNGMYFSIINIELTNNWQRKYRDSFIWAGQIKSFHI